MSNECTGRVCKVEYDSMKYDSLIVKSVHFVGIATVKLNRKPVNSLSHEMLTQIVINLEKLNNDRSIKGAILTSVSSVTVFIHCSVDDVVYWSIILLLLYTQNVSLLPPESAVEVIVSVLCFCVSVCLSVSECSHGQTA